MAEFEQSVVINRPVEKVFEFVSYPENEPLWVAGVQEAEQTSEGPMGVGTTLRSVGRILGRTIESTWEVTEYEVNRKRVVKNSSGPFPLEFVTVFKPVDAGTKITLTVQAEVGGFLKLAEPVLVRMVKRRNESQWANLKDLLEAEV
ncbi:MAG: SRPBCC family protein [Nitrospirota bacterium]|nr:MAG: SRPBCC family protein [Nitrospirota bacterium]